jgi:hypothetical protein
MKTIRTAILVESAREMRVARLSAPRLALKIIY